LPTKEELITVIEDEKERIENIKISKNDVDWIWSTLSTKFIF
jgi:hypothetical protein